MQQVPRFTATPTFYNDLRERVQTYFADNNKSMAGNWRIYLKAIILLTTLVSCYVTLVFFTPSTWLALPICLLMGLTVAGIGFNIMHDGAHGSFSKNKTLNMLAAYTLNILGGSSYIWNIKHNVVHHSFTNVDGMDADIEAQPFLRMCRSQDYKPFHRFQHIYVVFFYSFMYFFWMFYLDYKRYFIGKIGGLPITNMSTTDHIVFWASKITCYILMLVIPIWQVGFVPALVGYFAFVTVTGFVLSVVFQLAHTVEHTEFPLPDDAGRLENEWAIHQVQTTANFATRNRIVTWFCGGLNFQIEHHLFPKISHIHYPAISSIVRKACADYNLQYIEFPRLDSAVKSHWKLLYDLGQSR